MMTCIFATANTSEDCETQKHSYNRPFLDGNVSAALVGIPEISPSQRTNRTTCDTRDQLVTVCGWKRVGSTCCDTGDQPVSKNKPYHLRYQRSARDRFWMEMCRQHLLRYRRSARPKEQTVPLAIPEISSRPFLDGNVLVALAIPEISSSQTCISRQQIRAKIAKPRSTRTIDRFWMETYR